MVGEIWAIRGGISVVELYGKNVTLLEGELKRRANANRAYMMRLDRDNLLLNYRLEAGLYTAPYLPKNIHGGWESPTCQLRGHFTGHWLSAAALHYSATGDMEMKGRADYIVNAIAECQQENGGEWAASIPEKYLHWIAGGKAVWAPQYAIHKTFMGLADMAQYAGNAQALEVADNFSKWFLRWSEKFTREQFDDILDVETGGMLEIWAQLYSMTKNDSYLKLMDKYYRVRLFDALLEGKDVLTNMHANTTIPEIIGCALAYEATGKQRWRDIVEAYWNQAVTQRGTYATGGQTCGEIWTPKQEMAARIGMKNQEYCTVYNMMRLAEFIFRWTGEAAYMDYRERNLYNGIMAQSYWHVIPSHGAEDKYPHDGLLTYFLPLQPGARKGWATETEDFFCCHGTLVQSNAQLNRGIYYRQEDSLIVCQYIDSQVAFEFGDTAVTVLQKYDSLAGSFHMSSTSVGKQGFDDTTHEVPNHPDAHVACFQITADKPVKLVLKLRIPTWAKGWELLLNGENIRPSAAEKGFIIIDRVWDKKDSLRLVLPKQITAVPLPGNENMTAFLYGPIVLAGLCDEERTLSLNSKKPEELLTHDNEREWGSWKSTFKVTGQQNGMRFIPLYEVGYERYSVYFPLAH